MSSSVLRAESIDLKGSGESHQTGRFLTLLRPWVLLLPFMYFAGASWSSSQDRAYGDMLVATTQEDHTLTRLAWMLAYGLTGLVAIESFRRTASAMRRNLWAVTISLLAVASCLWSAAPGDSIKMGLFLVATTLVALWFSEAFSWEDQMKMIMLTGTAMALASTLVVIFVPSVGLDSMHGTNWQGIFYSKNHCGRIMLFLLTPVLYFPWKKSISGHIIKTAYFLLAIFLIGMSRSRSAWFVTVLYLACFFFMRQMRRFRGKEARAANALAVPVVAAAVVGGLSILSAVLAATGRDLTFSGRTTIWRYLLEAISMQPVLGYGYDAFWQSGQGFHVFMAVRSTMRFMGSYAHNGYLDVALQLGLLGLVLLLYSFVAATRNFLAVPRFARTTAARWYFGIIVLSLVYNIDEATFCVQGHLPWMMYIFACAGLLREATRRNEPSLRVREIQQFDSRPSYQSAGRLVNS
jgi:exopolysaccharide production protein ExoQ